MILQQILQDKDNWKRDTFQILKKNLLSVKSNRFIQYGETQETHLVCIYGKSQVGKTTLILNMIGLKDEECKQKVSQVLRGGVEKGNSSTSTAIIYTQSETNDYCVRIETLDGNIIKENVECTPDEMIRQLQSIRNDVENNALSSKGILHIAIPKDYFSPTIKRKKLTILDLPGIESRNLNERAHVESLMSRYIPMSSVCVITCNASQIQSLENEELPNGIDWKSFPQRFVVVLTKAYIDGTIKEYFKKNRTQRTQSFKDFVQEKYRNELTNVIGKNCQTEVFPIDVGESFNKLYNNELTNDDDRKELLLTRNSLLDALHEFVEKQKGERLLSTIKELRFIVEKYDNEKNENLENSKNNYGEENEKLNDKLRKEKKNIEHYSNDMSEIERRITNKNYEINQIKETLNNAIVDYSKNVIKNIKEAVTKLGLVKEQDDEPYFKDNGKKLKKEIYNCLDNLFDNKIKVPFYESMDKLNVTDEIYGSVIVNSIYNDFIFKYERELYPELSLWEKLWDKSKVKLTNAYSYIDEIKNTIFLNIPTFDSKINRTLNETKQERNEIKQLINKSNERIIKYEERIKENKKKINEFNELIETVKSQKQKDEQTIETYLTYAKEAYINQRNEIIRKINSNITPTEKTLQIFLLGIIDNDYKNLIKNTDDKY